MDQIGLLRNTLKSFERNVYTLNTELRDVYVLKEALERLMDSFESIKNMLKEHPELEPLVKDYMRHQDLLVYIKEMKHRYESLYTLFRTYYKHIESIESFFERYRDYRYYYVPEKEKMMRMIEMLTEGEGKVTLRLTLARKPLDPAFARDIGGEFVDSFSVRVPAEFLPAAIDKLLTRCGGCDFSVESSNKTISYKYQNSTLRVTSSERDILEVADYVAQKLGIEIIDI